MTENWIRNGAVTTAALLPVVIMLATIIIWFMVGFISYKRATRVLEIGLVFTVVSFAVAALFILINVL